MFILAGHGVLAVLLAQNRLGERFDQVVPAPVQITLISEESAAPAPQQVRPNLVDLRPDEIQLPKIETPLVESTLVQATITVARSLPEPAAAAAPTVSDAAPLLVERVEYLSKVMPAYPLMARRARAQGTVLLRVLIGPDGCPVNVTVDRSSGHALLDRAASEAVMHYRFKPYRENGVARTVQAVVPIDFSLTVRTASRG